MPSNRKIPPFRSVQPKATTPLQQQLLRTQAQDLAHAEASNAALANQLNPPDLPQAEEHLGVDVGGYAQEAEAHEMEQDEVGEEDEGIDLNRFMPDRAPPPVGDNAEDPISAALHREAHLADRLAHKKQWLWQYAIMLPTFLRGRLKTLNWGDQTKWNEDLRPVCNCTMRTEHNVDLVDFLSRCRTKVLFCKNCDLSDPQRLLQVGYMAALPLKPRTAFSIRLLVHHHSQWIRFAVPTEGFCNTLDSALDSSNPVILTSSGQPRNWSQPFSLAVDAYRSLINQILMKATELFLRLPTPSAGSLITIPPLNSSSIKSNSKPSTLQPNPLQVTVGKIHTQPSSPPFPTPAKAASLCYLPFSSVPGSNFDEIDFREMLHGETIDLLAQDIENRVRNLEDPTQYAPSNESLPLTSLSVLEASNNKERKIVNAKTTSAVLKAKGQNVTTDGALLHGKMFCFGACAGYAKEILYSPYVPCHGALLLLYKLFLSELRNFGSHKSAQNFECPCDDCHE
ncbi:uncharacterized protein MELLADRAFT_68616 [Melampsora larici-populina 98AG31]|uniref:CxC1-like cysteine cluster associated with KDZ transposases domain-containing protein n=1 Tax=Melampsora larici-populina (strain 98AG31 / pathotype 3-4-7) TaxID=747676 RepID=F4S7F9_MELLP|nr:uncharacterized protein MELLADRAFT_68616 [Melampsora larici-populina 98AG31]EGF99434.1 hypothetical protein MELLADRAFT_68616 [Melampsora larici-populina 98AG31]